MATKKPSRAARWEAACVGAELALQALKDVQEEYQEWFDNLPENLRDSAVGEKLETVCDVDVEGVLDQIVEAGSLDLPQGFGRD